MDNGVLQSHLSHHSFVFSLKQWIDGVEKYICLGFFWSYGVQDEIFSRFIDSLFINHTRRNWKHYYIC